MSRLRSQNVIAGTFGAVWVNDEEWFLNAMEDLLFIVNM